MDFGYLLDLAKQNEDNSKDLVNVRRFSTEPSRAKKLQKSRVNTGNIQKFLAQKEQEEKQKQLQAKKKKEVLLNLREHEKGAKRRVSAMLNRTKGANRSVLEDAKDKYNTAATLNGAYQPDEDDYGYESKASADIYAKMLSKYEKIPDKDYLKRSKSDGKRQLSLDLNATKARVKQSLDNQEEEERNMKGHRRRKSKKDGDSGSSPAETSTASSSKQRSPSPPPQKDKDRKHKKSAKRPNALPPPPGLDFQSILQLAAKKQHQPVALPERPVKPESEQRPMTAKEKIELEECRRRELRKQGKLPPAKHKDYSSEFATPRERKNRVVESVPKQKDESKSSDVKDRDGGREKVQSRPERDRERAPDKDRDRDKDRERPRSQPSQPGPSSSRPKLNIGASPSDQQRSTPARPRQADTAPSSKRRPSPPPAPNARRRPSPPPAPNMKRRPSPPTAPSAKRRPSPPAAPNAKRKQFPPADMKPKQFPPADLKPKQFPPADVKRKQFKPENMKRFAGGSAPKPNRIESSDSEYDSEMDDFIDDGPLGGENDYSSAIKEIFGYDKSKYRDMDEDLSDMEAGFSTVMQEEARSAKIALQEDEAELRKEMEHKRRKMAMKKRASAGR